MDSAIVPAAGRSSRLGRNKALLPFGSSLLLDAVIETLRAGGIDRIVVVAAPGETSLLRHCDRRGYELTVNERVADGMLSSVRLGLTRLTTDGTADDAIAICPVDFPAVRPATIATLLSAVRTSEQGIAVPRFQSRRGHPLVFSARFAAQVHDLDLTRGLRQLLDHNAYESVEVDDPAILRDLDTWLDYAELTAGPQN